MRNFQEKSTWRRVMETKPMLCLLGVVVLFFAWDVLLFMSKMNDTVKNRKIAENKVTELRQEKDKLASDIEKLKTNTGVEETIRDKFGLVKEGEDVIVIVDDKKPEADSQEASGGGVFGFFKNLFK